MTHHAKIPKTGIVGIIICILLTVSFFLDFTSFEALETVMKIIAICFSVHLIRSTGKLLGTGVLKKHVLVLLIAMQIFNLLLISFMLTSIFPSVVSFFSSTLAGSLIVAFFSLPMFFLYYFTWIIKKREISQGIARALLFMFILCGIYLIMHIANTCVLPMMARHGFSVSDTVARIFSFSRETALFVYLTAAVSFGILQFNISRKMQAE